MSGRTLNPGSLPKAQRRSSQDRHLLALSGGGYRGLFTAKVLAAAETAAGRPTAQRFDMMAGTSIGGILAIGLACGVSAADLAAVIQDHGAAIFRPRLLSFSGYGAAHYGNTGLKSAILRVLGPKLAKRPFAEIPAPLIVTSVQDGTSTPHIFRSEAADLGAGSPETTLDVALATSAAPTFFPAHRIGDRVYVDGGLIANAPDLVLLTDAMRRFGCSLSECRLMSIGTAGSARIGGVEGGPGKLSWMARHKIIELIMHAQEALVVEQVHRLRPASFLRIDAEPVRPIDLDDTDGKTSERLIDYAAAAVAEAERGAAAEWRRFLASTAVR